MWEWHVINNTLGHFETIQEKSYLKILINFLHLKKNEIWTNRQGTHFQNAQTSFWLCEYKNAMLVALRVMDK